MGNLLAYQWLQEWNLIDTWTQPSTQDFGRVQLVSRCHVDLIITLANIAEAVVAFVLLVRILVLPILQGQCGKSPNAEGNGTISHMAFVGAGNSRVWQAVGAGQGTGNKWNSSCHFIR